MPFDTRGPTATRPTRRRLTVAAALLLLAVFVAAPAAHAAPGREGPTSWLSLAWQRLAGWFPAFGEDGGLKALFAPEGSSMDPDGTPQANAPEGSDMDPNGSPEALFAPAGGDMDPNGAPQASSSGGFAPEGSDMDSDG